MEIQGKKYSTLQDAAKQFGVSSKTVREWITKKIISQPPKIRHGVRTLDHFPPEYIEKAKIEIEQYRRKKLRNKKS